MSSLEQKRRVVNAGDRFQIYTPGDGDYVVWDHKLHEEFARCRSLERAEQHKRLAQAVAS